MPASKDSNALLWSSIKSMHLFAVAAICAALITSSFLATAQTPAPSSKTKVKTTTQATQAKAEPLSGAELWAINCSRCHMARSPGEFTAGQWQTILRHMRVRANLPAAQAREIQKFMQAGAGK
jgi:mono/diheme cytochrome c family protein